MANNRYTADQVEWLRENAPGRDTYSLTELFNAAFGTNKERSHIRAALKNRKIRTGARRGQKGPKLLTPDQDQWIRKNYPKLSQKDLAKAFNTHFGTTLSRQQIISYLKNHQIHSGRTGHFKKGQTSWNKGKKMPPHPNSQRTQFKPGMLPHTTKYLGHERISKDGYREISVAQTNPHTGFHRRYVLKHRWVWEKENGPIPEGKCLKFLDSDRLNCDLDNLALIDRSMLPRLTKRGYDTAPPEIKPLIMTTAKLADETDRRRN